MRLTVATPLTIVVDADEVEHVRAEDETGAFGILAGHADFLAALVPSVVTWRDRKGAEHHVAVRGGMLEVRDGSAISIATREAVADDDLHRLDTDVLATFRRRIDEEKAARADSQRLYLAAVRQIYRVVRAAGRPGTAGGGYQAISESLER
jgi:F-type H+-transporting ATPase subunit epsilon